MTDNTKTNMTDNIWGALLKELVGKIKEADDKSYSINLLEEVKMANKFVRETKKNEKKEVSLRVNVDENANSRILAKLLQYKSPNGEYEILQSLLDYISNRDENAVPNFGKIKIDKDKPIITTEETLDEDKDRIDILVRTGKYAIIFENKLFEAGDQPYQLARYIEKVKGVKETNVENKSKYDAKNIFVIYLSRDGNEPDKNSWINRETNLSYSKSFASRYANISFREDIRCWLKDCVLPNVRKKDTDLESALVQYINYLDRMFMKNNDVLTNWLEEKLEEGKSNEPDHMVKIHRLEKVEGLLATLNKNKGKKLKINVERLADLISFTKDNTNEDLLNKTIAVIENLRDNCRDKVLEPFYRVSKDYFDEDEIRPSHPSAAYCRLFKKKWEGEIRFIWLPFFFNAEKNEYKLALEIILSKDARKNKNRIRKFNTVQNAIVQDAIKEIKVQESNIEISYKYEPQNNNNNSTDVSEEKEQASPRVHKLLEITLKTNEKLLYFAPKDQETLFRAIYDNLSGVIDAIDKCF